MTEKERGKEPKEAPKDEVLTRRAAMKRIAAGMAGVGIIVVTGIIRPVQASAASDPFSLVREPGKSGEFREYGNSVDDRDDYGNAGR